jgi:hypothetical protein
MSAKGKGVITLRDLVRTNYTTPELTVHGHVTAVTKFVGSGAVDGIVGIDVDGDGDDDTVIGNGS